MLKKIKRSYSNFTALLDYLRIHAGLKKERKLFFFFYTWAFGGAERIHISILRLFKTLDPLCFITTRSGNNGFKREFESSSTVINLGRWAEKVSYKKHMYKKLAKMINKQKSPVVFGSNSEFLYEMIPLLQPHVTIIDLLHNFADFKQGYEWHSLPFTRRIDKRIVLGEKLFEQLKDHYAENHIEESYLKRVEIIPNFVNIEQPFEKKDFNGILEVLFVARNSPEKRFHIVRSIAKRCHELALPLKFTILGDFEDSEDLPENIRLAGAIYDKSILNEFYKRSHIVLLTSRREGLPMVILEGMSFGLIPISTAVGELSAYIGEHKGNGYLIENPVDEEEIIASFVLKFTELLPERSTLEKVSKNAYDTVKREFSFENFAKAYRKTILGSMPK